MKFKQYKVKRKIEQMKNPTFLGGSRMKNMTDYETLSHKTLNKVPFNAMKNKRNT